VTFACPYSRSKRQQAQYNTEGQTNEHKNREFNLRGIENVIYSDRFWVQRSEAETKNNENNPNDKNDNTHAYIPT